MKTTRLLIIIIISAILLSQPGTAPAKAGERKQSRSEVVCEFLEDALSAALKKADKQDFDRAQQIAQAVGYLAPNPKISAAAKRVIEEIQEGRIAYQILESELIADRAVYESGDKLVLKARLYNRSMNPVKIPLRIEKKRRFIFWKKTEEKSNFIYMELKSTDYDILGGRVSITRHWREEYSEEILLQPGEFWEKDIEIELDPDYPARGSLRELKLSILFAPLIFTGDDDRHIHRRFRTVYATINVLPRGSLMPGADAVQSAMKALLQEDRMKLLYSVVCTDKSQRARLIPFLVRQLRIEKPNTTMERALIVCLQHITGFYGRLRKKMWLNWWRDRGEAFASSLNSQMRPAVVDIDIAADGAYTCKGGRAPLERIESLIKKAHSEGMVSVIARCSPGVEYRHIDAIRRICNKIGMEDVHFILAEEQDGSGTDE